MLKHYTKKAIKN